jgi:hypothetical protein
MNIIAHLASKGQFFKETDLPGDDLGAKTRAPGRVNSFAPPKHGLSDDRPRVYFRAALFKSKDEFC